MANLKRVAAAAANYARQRAQTKQAFERLARAIVDAAERGVKRRDIAEAARMTAGRVQQIITERRS